MTFVLGRPGGREAGPVADLGRYRALDGSEGARLALDLDGPHAALIVGKRGYGKSHTLGVLAEALARTTGIAPVVLDPMGEFGTLAERVERGEHDPVPARVVEEPTVTPDALDPRSWCELLEVSPESGAGGLVWRGAAEESTIPAIRDRIRRADAPEADRRSALNHLALAASWGVFDADGLGVDSLAGSEATVVDLSGLGAEPRNAVARGVGEALYGGRLEGAADRLPWLLVDEAHAFFEGVARDALERLLRRGRTPGVSLVLATQRPAAVPELARSQSDLLVSHRLTSRADVEALEAVRPTYVDGAPDERLPARPGEAAIVDDTTETVHAARIRRRHTPHGGADPSVTELWRS